MSIISISLHNVCPLYENYATHRLLLYPIHNFYCKAMAKSATKTMMQKNNLFEKSTGNMSST